MNAKIIKNKFLNFFKKNNYTEVNPSPLVLENDKSLLFTNSGMVQFKNIFLGLEKNEKNKVITIQPCVRLGGKHNDLDNIGKTPHHNTSFEMLGNFGFGQVNKDEIIDLAINFLIKDLNLNKKNIYITVNKNDIDTLKIWTKYIEKEKIILGSNDTNFWQMAENGPCGYCTEIFYNIEEKNEKQNLLEIWNIVFINFNKKNDKLEKLNQTYIDTGMGLERITSVVQNTFDNFKTDIYEPLIKITLDTFKTNEKDTNPNIRIITDHIKTCIMLMHENIVPSNDGRGYILKKLIRKSIIKKQELNIKTKLFNLISNFAKNIDNLNINATIIQNIEKIIKNEEIKYENTIKNGKNFIKKITQKEKYISGTILFTLYDTYGMPIDVIESFAKENNLKIAIDDFKKEMEKQIIKNKIKSKKLDAESIHVENISATIFLGYNNCTTSTTILKIIKNKNEANDINEKETGILITKETTFYSEKGGQIGDSGIINNAENIFEVSNTKDFNNIYFHYGIMKKGSLKKNDIVQTKIDTIKRKLTTNNHSATHLLHAVLKNILGNHIKQAGSLINENYLRFDFIHFNQISNIEKKQIEEKVNEKINAALEVKIDINNNEDKIKNRTIKIGENESIELCAGTHVKNTSEIGLFKILKEYGVGNNIRRIEAITNYKIINLFEENETLINNITQILKTNKHTIIEKITNLIDNNKKDKKYINELSLDKINKCIKNTLPVITKNKIKIIQLHEDISNISILHKLIQKLEKTIIVNFAKNKNKNLIGIIITHDIINISALKIIENLSKLIECTGGGNENIANGIIYKKIENNEIINHIQLYLENKLENKSEENVC